MCAVDTLYSFVLPSTFYTGHALLSAMRRKKEKCAREGQEGGEIGSCLTATAGDLRFPSTRWCPAQAGRELKRTPAGTDCISQRRNFSLCCTGKFCSLSALMLAIALVIPLLAHVLPSRASCGSTNAIHPSLHTQMKTGQVPRSSPRQGHQTNQQHKMKTCKPVVLNS